MPADRGCYRRLASDAMGDSVIDFLSGKRRVFVGYSLTDEDFVHIYDLVRQRLADTPRRSYIVTLDERVNSDTHPDAKVILTSGDRFLARIKFAAARYMLADDRYDEVTLELRALAGTRAEPTAIDSVTTPRSSTPFLPGWTDARPATSSRPIQDRGTRIRPTALHHTPRIG